MKKIQRFSPNVSIEIERGARLQIDNKVRAHSGCKFKIRKKGALVIGEGVSFNYNCMVFCHENIKIESGVEFGPGVLIYDHDHDYKTIGGLKAGKFTTEPVSIGENTWVGANTLILKGTKIGKNCVIAAGSVVKADVKDGEVFIQKRERSL